MAKRPNPIPIQTLPSADVTDTIISDLCKDIQKADQARTQWLENHRKLTEQRFGVRHGERKFPWPGAPDLRIPTQDKALRRWKPRMLSLVYDLDPVAYFRPLEANDVPTARLVESFYHWLFTMRMRSLQEMCYLVDGIGHAGFSFLQPSWDYRTEIDTRVADPSALWPEGTGDISLDAIAMMLMAEYDLVPREVDPKMVQELKMGNVVSLQYRALISDMPKVTFRDPTQVIAPAKCADIEDASFICIEHHTDFSILRQWAEDGRLDKAAVERVIDSVDQPVGRGSEERRPQELQLEGTLNRIEGVMGPYESPDRIRVWEVYTWAKWPNRERVVYWIHPSSLNVLAAHSYPYPFRRWPLVKFDHEVTFRRWNSPRGISKMLSPMATSINQIHNSRLWAIALQLAPVFKWRIPSGAIPRNFQIMPGRVIPVSELSDFEPVVQHLANIPLYTQEEYMTRQMCEDYVGLVDTSIMSPLRPTERRTAREVDMIAQTMEGAFGLDAKLFQLSMAEVHKMVWALWYEFGQPEIFFRVTNEEQPKLFRKSEVARDYDIVPSGTPANTSRMLEMARAREVMQLLAQDQTGLINHAELYRYYLDLLDRNLSKRILNPPEAMIERQILMQAAQQLAKGNVQEMMEEASAANQAQMAMAAQGLME